ncbi:MAG: hypothetical protein OEY89_15055 [Gammaproteobacteria bacterium]|nr:hypothetical protein [Gammaproteobacteria bacterium]
MKNSDKPNQNNLNARVVRLRRQIELERQKNFTMHEVIVRKFDMSVVSHGAADAEIAPVEKFDGLGDKAVIAFGGMATRLSMPVPEFARMLTEFGPDVFFAKDFRQAWYQMGLLGVSTDVNSTADFLAKLSADYNEVPKMVGTSAGGFAAVMFGAILGAPNVLAFSPQTLITEREVSRFASQDTRKEEVLAGKSLDLCEIISSNPSSDIKIYYGADHEEDTEAAERLKDLPGVTLYPCPTDSHNVAVWLRDQDKLGEVLRSSLL